jgi:hypothetical protein
LRKEKKKNFIVYPVGKVGSSSVIKGLENSKINYLQVYNYGSIEPILLKIRVTKAIYFFDTIKKFIINRIKVSILKRKKKVKIITFVREPYSRNMSAFFQHLSYFLAEKDRYHNSIDSREKTLDFLENMFINKYPHEYTVDWFDNELKKYFGVDVYQYPFDKDKGYSIIRKKNVEVLVIKVEKLNTLEEVIGDFLEIRKFKLINTNTSNQKWYSDLLIEFKKRNLLSQKIKATLYESKYFQHFYNEEEKYKEVKNG